LIIDDNSSDNTSDIVKVYADKDPRIIFFQRFENHGLTKNLNFLISRAKGKFVARMDSDDISHPTRLEEEINLMLAQNDIDLVWSNAICIDEKGSDICMRYQPSLEHTLRKLRSKTRRENHIVHPSVMFKKQTVIDLGGYDEEYRTGQDGDLWPKMIQRGCKFALINKPLLRYRVREGSATLRRSGCTDINFLYANLCLRNRQAKRSWNYIKAVKSPVRKLYLVIMLLLGANCMNFFRQFKMYDYEKRYKKSC
jgi:glycosyltransferase involved in cell wall biosynthesis